jgi:predicted transcriptional regulator
MSHSTGVAMTLRLPGDLHAKLRDLAWKHRTSMNHEINVAVRTHIDASKRGQK